MGCLWAANYSAQAYKSLNNVLNENSIFGVYRPKTDNPPLFYPDLVDRLGVGRPLNVLAEHGCDVGAELRDAEAAVRAYQDSPGRAAMLAKFTQLQGAR
jgi:hypothetical protein